MSLERGSEEGKHLCLCRKMKNGFRVRILVNNDWHTFLCILSAILSEHRLSVHI
uniref:Uncharacterized protein n=1 Tax=Arundo donax TaxID=35708 RepID=A0A0A9BWU2_ARUDO